MSAGEAEILLTAAKAYISVLSNGGKTKDSVKLKRILSAVYNRIMKVFLSGNKPKEADMDENGSAAKPAPKKRSGKSQEAGFSGIGQRVRVIMTSKKFEAMNDMLAGMIKNDADAKTVFEEGKSDNKSPRRMEACCRKTAAEVMKAMRPIILSEDEMNKYAADHNPVVCDDKGNAYAVIFIDADVSIGMCVQSDMIHKSFKRFSDGC